MPFEKGERVAAQLAPLVRGEIVRLVARDARGGVYAIRWDDGTTSVAHEEEIFSPDSRAS